MTTTDKLIGFMDDMSLANILEGEKEYELFNRQAKVSHTPLLIPYPGTAVSNSNSPPYSLLHQ